MPPIRTSCCGRSVAEIAEIHIGGYRSMNSYRKKALGSACKLPLADARRDESRSFGSCSEIRLLQAGYNIG